MFGVIYRFANICFPVWHSSFKAGFTIKMYEFAPMAANSFLRTDPYLEGEGWAKLKNTKFLRLKSYQLRLRQS